MADSAQGAAEAPSLPDWVPLDTLPLLGTGAPDAWRARELAHTPRYFRLVAWKDEGTLWGVAGCNPVEVAVDGAELVPWGLRACGGVAPAPDGRTLAWSGGEGDVHVGERGGAQRTVRQVGAPAPAGEGDPSGATIWSPDGSRVLVTWSAEWESSYAVVDASTGATRPIATREEGYYLTEAWGYLDDERILFSTQASRDLQGRSEYSESGGQRADLALFDLRDSSYRKVTSVPDGVFLRPLARWGDAEVLVGERGRGAVRYRRYWLYDVRDWSRRPIELPAAADVRVHDPKRVLLLDPVEGQGGAATVRVHLWTGAERPVLPLVEIRGGEVAWSPDGLRIAVTTTTDEPVSGMTGSFQTRYHAYVLEPR